MNDHHRGYRYEFIGQDPGPLEDLARLGAGAVASDRGTGPLGFAGTAPRKAGDDSAAGLTRLATGEFSAGPLVPMLPGTWGPNRDGDDGEWPHGG